MEFWILGVGALVLIGLAVWIVWPGAPAGEDAVAAPSEALEAAITPPIAVASVPETAPPPRVEAPLPAVPAIAPEPTQTVVLPRRGSSRAVNLMAAVALAVGGAVSGAWIYSRWQKQQQARRTRRWFFR